MVRLIQNHGGQTYSFSSIPLAIGMFVSVSILVALCAKHARKRSSHEANTPQLKSPFPSATKQMIATISHKAMVRLVHAKKSGLEFNSKIFGNNKKLLGHGESAVWQKSIMMGEKCKPLEFSGVIYYDCDGNRIPEIPKSPRISSCISDE